MICVSSWDPTDNKTFCCRKKSGILFDELKSISDPFGTIDRVKAQQIWDMKFFPARRGWNRMSTF